jgi:hypothetical protein
VIKKTLAIYLRAGRVVLFLADWESEESSTTETKMELGKGRVLLRIEWKMREREDVKIELRESKDEMDSGSVTHEVVSCLQRSSSEC